MDNSENEIPSDEDDVSAQYLCYIYLGGTILSPREPDLSNYDSENTSNPPWDSTWGRPYHEQISGCSVNVTGSGIGGNGITLNDSSTTTRARVSTQSTYTIKFTATVGAGYTFAGWWAYSSESEPISWSRVSRSLTWEIRVSDYSYLFSRDSSPENNYICGIFYRTAPATYNNIYRYINTSGLQASTTQTRTYGQNFTTLSTSSISEYVSNGWSLYGWANSSGDTDRDFATNASVSSYNSTTGTIYLYAISSRTIRINYNANGGSNAPSATASTQRWNQYGNRYNISSLTVTSSEPTRTGYTFSGWSTSNDNTVDYDAGDTISFTYSSSNSITLYAVWEANTYVVNFDTDNEITYPYSRSQSSTQGTYSTYVENNVLIYDYTVTSVGINGPHSGGITLDVGEQYKWSIDVKCSRNITIRSMGHEMGGVRSNVAVTTSWQTITHTFTATTNANNYHAFIFYNNSNTWQEGDVFSYKNLSIQKVSGMKADNAIGNLTVTYGGTYANLPTPTKTGYTFQGWYLDSNFQTQVTSTTKVATASDHTLYSKWQINAYKISFDSDGGSVIENDYVTYNDYYYKKNLYDTSKLDLDTGLSISDNIITVNYTSTSRTWLGFNQEYDSSLFSPGATYTVVMEVLSVKKGAYVAITSPEDVSSQTDIANEYVNWTITSTGVWAKTFTVKDLNDEKYDSITKFNFRSYIDCPANTTLNFSFRISMFIGENININNFNYASFGSVPSSNILPTPTKTGYTFKGWYLDSEFKTQVTSATQVVTASDHTLYSRWEIYKFRIDVNIVSPNGVQDYNSGTMNLYYSYNNSTHTNLTDQPSDSSSVPYNSTITISNIKPATGMALSNVTASAGKIVNNNDGTYTFTANMGTAPSGSWDSVIKINMKYQVYTITLNKQSGSGGTSTIYLKYNTGWYSNSAATSSIVKVSVPTRAGFTFQGYYTGTNGSGTQVINSSGQIISGRTTITTSNISLHAYWTAKNPARYDSEKGYWYVEMGYYPQTRATETEINGITNTNGAVYTIKGTNVTSKIGANSIEYCQYNGVWYKVEPVRYVLSGNYSSGYGTESGNVVAVTEQIVFASAWSSTKLSLGDGYTSSTLRTNISDFISDTQMNIDYTGARSYTIKNFRNVNGASADTTLSVDIIVSNESEIESVFGDLSAEFSDLVSDILGNNLMYWTRDVGSNLNTAECITRLGSSTQTIMQKILGVRLTANVSTFGCL